MQKLARDSLNKVAGGTTGGKTVPPKVQELTIDDLKKIAGGSGGGKGVNPKITAFIIPLADSFAPLNKEETNP